MQTSSLPLKNQLVCIDLQSSSHGTVLMNIGRQLVDGHWVLSFATPQQAQDAQDMMEQHTARLRTLHGEAMLPMLASSRSSVDRVH